MCRLTSVGGEGQIIAMRCFVIDFINSKSYNRGGMIYISNASSILLLNILTV